MRRTEAVLAGEQVVPVGVRSVVLRAEPEVVQQEVRAGEQAALRAEPEVVQQEVRAAEQEVPEGVQPGVVPLLALALPPA